MRIKKILIILTLLVVGTAIWGFLIEPNFIITERISIKTEDAPEMLKDLKLLQISDLHIKEFGYRETKVLKIIKKESPDFVLITGDIVDWTTNDFSGLEKFIRELSQFGSDKIFAVFGNHDHRNNNFKKIKNILSDNRINVLNNESKTIETAGQKIYLVGVDDPHLGYDDINRALKETEAGSFKVLLAHSPEIFRKAIGKVNLVLAGHTHGCQVAIVGLCDLVMPLEYDKKYKEGLFKENSTYLYVNRGLGMTFIPFRLNAFPEVTVINFE
jgi:uncharacterized protein